jgi:hypothetical protein
MSNNTVILDIDGILADYRLGLLWWINVNYPELREVCYTHLIKTDTWLNHETMKVTFRKWLDILDSFRMSGGKLTIPLFPGVKELFNLMNGRNHRIVLITSRPIDICSNIYHDTVEWLKQNELEYNMLLWSKSKSEMVHKMKLIDDCLFAVDDELGHVMGYINLGIKTYWVNHYHKGHSIISPYLFDVLNLKEIIEKERSVQ